MPSKPTAVAFTAALVLLGLVGLPLAAAAQTSGVIQLDRSGATKSPSPSASSGEGSFSATTENEDEKEDDEKEDEDKTPSPTPSPTKKPSDDGKTPSPKPSENSPEPKPSASSAVLGKPDKRDDDKLEVKPHDEAHEEAHEISTPPILIRPQGTNTGSGSVQGNSTNPNSQNSASGKYVSAPLGHYLDDSLVDGDIDSGQGVATFDTNANPPVIENIIATGYSTPADEFMAKSYFGLGILALAAGLLSFKVFSRRESDNS